MWNVMVFLYEWFYEGKSKVFLRFMNKDDCYVFSKNIKCL